MQQCQVFRYNTLYLVGYEYLVAVELNLILLNLEAIVNLREVENTCKIEWIVNVHMDIEQWLLAHWVQLAVELLVLLLCNVGWFASPEWLDVVNDIILLCINVFTVLPLFHFAKCNGHRQEVAILLQKFIYLLLIAVLLAVIRDVKYD